MTQPASPHQSAPARAGMLPASLGHAGDLVPEDPCPVEWTGGLAVVALPEHIGASNAGQVRELLLSVINRGATTLIADMTVTASCDHAGADAVIRAWQRADASGTELRLVVTATSVSRVLDLRGLDRLISIYPSLEAALAARLPAAAAVLAAAGPSAPATPAAPLDSAAAATAMATGLLDALQDAVALAGADGVIAAADPRLEDMFGYGPGELPGRPVESLVPDGVRKAHRGHRATWAQAPRPRQMGAGARLAGRRKDGTTFPVRVSLTPVTTAAGPHTLAVVRDLTRTSRLDDLAALARDAATARHENMRLLDEVVTGLLHARLTLQAAIDQPAGARQRTEEALSDLDDIIRKVRDATVASPAGSRPDGQ